MIEKINIEDLKDKADEKEAQIIIAYKMNEVVGYLNGDPTYDEHKPELKEEEVSTDCPECPQEHPSGTCKICEGTGIQQTGLTKAQAQKALDEGWIIGERSFTRRYVKHDGRTKYWYGNEPLMATELHKGDRYNIVCPAIETKEGLKTWEALKLLDEGWEIMSGTQTTTQATRGFKHAISFRDEWTAKKHNYPSPKEK